MNGRMLKLETANEHGVIISNGKLVNRSVCLPLFLIRTQCTEWNPSTLCGVEASSLPLSPHPSLFPLSIPSIPRAHALIDSQSFLCVFHSLKRAWFPTSISGQLTLNAHECACAHSLEWHVRSYGAGLLCNQLELLGFSFQPSFSPQNPF